MSGPEIQIRFRWDCYPSDRDLTVCLPLEEFMTYEAGQGIVFPSLSDEDPVALRIVEAHLVTPFHVRERRVSDRNALADMVAKAARRIVMDALEKHDSQFGGGKP